MISRATTLGQFLQELMRKHGHTNRSLAGAAGVSEGAIRNLLKFGIEANVKEPDARTLSRVATALDIDALSLFRLAGYIPPKRYAQSPRAEYLADVFDTLPPEKQDAVMGVLEAMSDKPTHRRIIRAMREDPSHPLAGFDLQSPHLVRLIANLLIAELQMTEPVDVDRIPPEQQIMQYTWRDLPQGTQERIKSLIRYKLSLDYDPTMVDPEWRT